MAWDSLNSPQRGTLHLEKEHTLTEQMPLQNRLEALGGIYVSNSFHGAFKTCMWKAHKVSFLQITLVRLQNFPAAPPLPRQNTLLSHIPTESHYMIT